MIAVVPVSLPAAAEDRSYEIHLGAGLLDDPQRYGPLERDAAIITNEVVAPLYLERARRALAARGCRVLEVVLPDGEAHKGWASAERVYDALIEGRCDRKVSLVALGGGVIGDLTGFVAATYQRGVAFVQVPTTLLAQVDASVGGKVAINHRLGKNLVGAFHQPRRVLMDLQTLRTLPPRELRAGLAEIIKTALICDADLLGWLEGEGRLEALLGCDVAALRRTVQRCCEIKAEVVARDEREAGPRALLNLGHTFGHAIEAGLGYGVWLHGEAVAAGLMLAARLSQRLGDLDEAAVARVERLLIRAGLPTVAPALGEERYLELMSTDKKVEAGRIRFVLLRRLGEAYLAPATPEAPLRQVLREGCG